MRRASKRKAERGQMLIIFALIIVPVTFAIGAVAVDASVWQSERRGAQKDADFAALAGAYELLEQEGNDEADAVNAAGTYADENDEAGNGTDNESNLRGVTVDGSCFDDTPSGRLDSVVIDLDHDSRTFFAEAFGLDLAPSIGAHARACAGSIVTTTGLRPYGIEADPNCENGPGGGPPSSTNGIVASGGRLASPPQHHGQGSHPTFTPAAPTSTPTPGPSSTPFPTSTPGGTPPPDPDECRPSVDSDCFEWDASLGMMVPKFGAICQLDDGSLDPSTSERGLIDLNNGPGLCSNNQQNDIRDGVQYGNTTNCSIGDEIVPQPGGNNGNDLKGLANLFAGMGEPPVADGADCDQESWGDGDGFDDPDEVLERIDGGTTPSTTAIYQLKNCVSPRVINIVVINNFDADPVIIRGFAAFYVLGCNLPDEPPPTEPNRCDQGPVGQRRLWGIFYNKLETDGDIGAFDPLGPKGIRLVE